MQLKSIALAAIAAFIVAFATSAQSDNGNLVFPSLLELDQTNRGTVEINGNDRHFSVTFPTSYDNSVAYPVVLFFHGCMCDGRTDEEILSYLDWKPKLESYRDDFITIKMSSLSETKQGGDRGKWLWHENFVDDRDDFTFVDTLITELLSASDINIDPENIFGVGHSSGAIFLVSYVLGGPLDLDPEVISDAYTFKVPDRGSVNPSPLGDG